jgi:hypothetical protein
MLREKSGKTETRLIAASPSPIAGVHSAGVTFLPVEMNPARQSDAALCVSKRVAEIANAQRQNSTG